MLVPDENTIRFIIENQDCDTSRLTLSRDKYPTIDIPFAVRQIEARSKIKYKVPEWYNHPEIIYPSLLSLEQCSSQNTALFKSTLIDEDSSLADLTGGMGVDSYFFSLVCSKVVYFEKNPDLSQACSHNFKILHRDNIHVNNLDVTGKNILQLGIESCQWIYIDPARRSDRGSRLFSIKDCDPDVSTMITPFTDGGKNVMLKLSPMLDVASVIEAFPSLSEIYIVASDNECKELLAIFRRGHTTSGDEIPIHCVNIRKQGITDSMCFTRKEENETLPKYADLERIKESQSIYLYEPNRAILKGGAFKYIGERYGLEKISKHSHLYIGDKIVGEFPGRVFRIEEITPFNKETINRIKKSGIKANISAKHFPLTSEKLKERLGIKDGGESYIFGTTTIQESRILIFSTSLLNSN